MLYVQRNHIHISRIIQEWKTNRLHRVCVILAKKYICLYFTSLYCFHSFKTKAKSIPKNQAIALDKTTAANDMISYFGIGACSVFHCLFLSLVVVHLGNCFYTRRIERLGNAPILSSGFEQRRVLVNESTNSERQQSKAPVQKSPSTSSSNKLRDDEIVPIIRGMQVIQMNLSKAENRLRKQMNFPSFQKVALNVYNDFPMKFYK